MFGIVLTTKKKLGEQLKMAKDNAYSEAVFDIIEILKQSEKIYLEPVTLSGNDHTIKNCVFLGTKLDTITLNH